jgi:hypothetical protein
MGASQLAPSLIDSEVEPILVATIRRSLLAFSLAFLRKHFSGRWFPWVSRSGRKNPDRWRVGPVKSEADRTQLVSGSPFKQT